MVYVAVGVIGFLIGGIIASVILFKDKHDDLMTKIAYAEDEVRRWRSESEIANFRYTSYKELYELQRECALLRQRIGELEDENEEIRSRSQVFNAKPL